MWPVFAADEIAAAAEVLASGRVNYWTGDQGRLFEVEFAAAIGARHAVLTANGTVALEIAIASLGLPRGTEVITTPRTFVATATAILANGLRPVFADVDPDSGNITPTTAAAVMTPATGAIVVVHLAGWPADMPGFRELADRHGVGLVEDCAQAHGARIEGRSVGTFGDVAAWSFCQDKILSTAGEGGMITTDSEVLWRECWSRKDHGKSWDAVHERQHPPGFRWLHEGPGTNGRATEFQAAVGRVQLRKLPGWTLARARNAAALADGLRDVTGIAIPLPGPGITHAHYRLNAYVDLDVLAPGWTRDRVIAEVADRHGVRVFTGSCSEIYCERALAPVVTVPPGGLPVARRMTESSLAFLVDPTLDRADMEKVGGAVADVLGRVTRRGCGGYGE